ncbi:S-adenosyl-L-methionine-dependent methyltransferase [Truncatella angustata]|uniref:S-adenosyl-L-methionine-dependent methyltransferase n=1 Tax=Truncatella angustata TaxID=152316 RepID=A0A9P8UJY1_9PEZI|nr:S-adenosyl-L-methionine-dependent methyltransferase [Truncatella angustata]KAH6653383.1 S-adenosyl-L-methionine-dependent methyltransferase [Truncatella angustata]
MSDNTLGPLNKASALPDQSLQPHEQKPWFLENGRYYGNFCTGRNMLPVDKEEQDRMDMMHELFCIMRKPDTTHGLHEARLHTGKPLILDLGCGTGIWAMDMAAKYPDGIVIGLDLNFWQPESIPPNTVFKRQDIEERQWDMESDSVDLIHIRMLSGSIRDWCGLYKNALQYLKPGEGVIEHVEIDWEPLSDDNSLPSDSKFRLWFNEVNLAYEDAGQPISLKSSPKSWFEEAGFVDIRCNIKEIPCHPWPRDKNFKEAGTFFQTAAITCRGMEALSMAPLTRYRQFTKEQVTALVQGVEQELRTESKRAHCRIAQPRPVIAGPVGGGGGGEGVGGGGIIDLDEIETENGPHGVV